MTVATDRVLAVTDAEGRSLGEFRVEETRESLVLGTFAPGPDYPQVAGVFATFEELANDQILSLIDNAFDAIADLGVRVSLDGRTPVRVDDVQIWSDGNASFRLPSQSSERNGHHPPG